MKAQRSSALKILKNLVRSAISVIFYDRKLKLDATYAIVADGRTNCALSPLI